MHYQKRILVFAFFVIFFISIVSGLDFQDIMKWLLGSRQVSLSPDNSGYVGSGYGVRCRDSDGGLNYLVKGVADNRINGIGSYYEDVCLFRNQTGPSSYQYISLNECRGSLCNLQEGYCSGNVVSNIAYKCLDGCKNGSCACFGYADVIQSRNNTFIQFSPPTSSTALQPLAKEPNANIGKETQGLILLDKDPSKKSLALIKTQERKKSMLALAEKNPKKFLSHTLSEAKQKDLSSNVKKYIEKAVTVDGALEVFEKPHLTDKEVMIESDENSGFDYFIRAGNKKYVVKFADYSRPKAKSGDSVRVSGVVLDNYLITSGAETRAFVTISSSPPINDNIGLQKVAIIITKAPGAQDPLLPYLQEAMQKANLYFQEASYGQTSLTWDVYGPYEVSSDIVSLKDEEALMNIQSNIDYSHYSRIIWIDARQICGACAQVGKSIYQTPSGRLNLSFIYFRPSALTDGLGSDAAGHVAHELGHNFGIYHAGFLNCAPEPLRSSDPSGRLKDCNVVAYGDALDVMGLSYYHGHFNAAHKEAIGWMRGNVQTISTNGRYVLSAFENVSTTNALKIPRKLNDLGNAIDFYYVEYRTPTGQDQYVVLQTQNTLGPQIRLTGYVSGGGGGDDTQLIDMTPRKYVYSDYPGQINDHYLDVGVMLGQTFRDPLTNISIKTVNVSNSNTTIDVALGGNCIRRNPSLRITPLNLQGKISEEFFYRFELINNDSGVCSDREIYITLEKSGENYPFASILGSALYPAVFHAGEIIRDSFSVYPFLLNREERNHTLIVSVFDVQRGILARQNITAEVYEELPTPSWPGQDIARRFLYTESSNGYYILDKFGNVYRAGDTKFTTNTGFSEQGNAKEWALTMMDYKDSILIVNSKGEVYDIGRSEKNKYFARFEMAFPLFGCSIVRDIKGRTDITQLYLLDAYGSVYTTLFPTDNPRCQTWDGRKDSYRPGQDHAKMIQVDGYRGYYLLSKDGTTYACGKVPHVNLSYTKLNQPFNASGDRYAVAFALNPSKGIVMLDSYGKVYTSGEMIHLGEPNFGRDIARDIQLLPNGDGNEYGILAGDGTVYTYRNQTPVWCNDTDNGLNYTVKGDTFNATINLTDLCIDSTSLYEGVCNGTAVISTKYSCPNGCEKGACKEPGPNITALECQSFGYNTQLGNITCCDTSCKAYDLVMCANITYLCTDNDAFTGDNQYFIASYINYTYIESRGPRCDGSSSGSSGGGTAPDKCGDNSLIEQTCKEDGSPTYIQYFCKIGCREGACVEESSFIAGPNNGNSFVNEPYALAQSSVGSTNWEEPRAAKFDDGNKASIILDDDDISNYLKATYFNFSIPAEATITGITVEVKASRGGSTYVQIRDESVRLVKNGIISGDERASVTYWPIKPSYKIYGGSSDLWGLSWTPEDINSGNFGVAISAFGYNRLRGGKDAYIDHISISISYNVLGGGGGGDGSNESSLGAYGKINNPGTLAGLSPPLSKDGKLDSFFTNVKCFFTYLFDGKKREQCG